MYNCDSLSMLNRFETRWRDMRRGSERKKGGVGEKEKREEREGER